MRQSMFYSHPVIVRTLEDQAKLPIWCRVAEGCDDDGIEFGVEISWELPPTSAHSPITSVRVHSRRSGGYFIRIRDIDVDPIECSAISMSAVVNSDGVSRRFVAGATYEFRVVCVNERGESDPSDIVSASIPSIAKNNAPAPLSVTIPPRDESSQHATPEESPTPTPAYMVDLPENWAEYYDPSQDELYYYNFKTGENKWDAPPSPTKALNSPKVFSSPRVFPQGPVSAFARS